MSCGVSWAGRCEHCVHAQLWYLPKGVRIMGCLCIAKGTPGDKTVLSGQICRVAYICPLAIAKANCPGSHCISFGLDLFQILSDGSKT